MKKKIGAFCLIFMVLSCNNNAVEKPNNLIERDKMVNVLYDVSLLEAIKTQNIHGGITNKKENEYIYKKYNIDSVQFVESNRYYASDLDEYKKMFEEIRSRLDKETKVLETRMKKKGELVPAKEERPVNPDRPQVQ